MRTFQVAVVLPVVALLWSAAPAQKLPVDQWPNYQHNSNFSPLTQITPANVTQLTNAWTFHYGTGTKPSGNLELDYRFELQPLIVGGVMYVSTPALREDPELKSTISAIEPETGKLLIEGSGFGHANARSFEIANKDDVAAMGFTDPVEHMKSAIIFKTPADEVHNEHNKVWGDLKALKQ